MPISKSLHRTTAAFAGKSTSFHGRGSAIASGSRKLRRPKTIPNSASASMTRSGIRGVVSVDDQERPKKLMKLLMNVTMLGSVGAVQVLMSSESTVADLIAAAVRQYVKVGRRPVFPTSDTSGFKLHYSQFSLESLNREEKLVLLGSRIFFLCTRITSETTSFLSCKNQLEKTARTGFGLPWLNFIGFLQ